MVSCFERKDFIENPAITTEKATYELPSESGSMQVSFMSNMPWEIFVTPANSISEVRDIKVTPTSGNASKSPIKLTVTFNANKGTVKRSALVSIIGTEASAAFKLTQDIPGSGSGPAKGSTVDNPYPALDLVADMKSGVVLNGESLYIEGIVSKIKEISLDYKNATFWLTADGTHPANDDDAFQVYRTKGFEGEDITDAKIVKLGDKVVIYGPVTLYKGNTPETEANKAKIVSVIRKNE